MKSNEHSPASQRIALIGGGHSHVQFLRYWREAKIPGVTVVMISSPVMTPYSGMLPGYLAGWYQRGEMHFDLERLCAQADVKFICAEVSRLDPLKKEIKTTDGASFNYDVASINIGISPTLPRGAQNHPHVTAVKPISELLEKWERLMRSSARRWLIVGGGGSGFELAVILSLRKPGSEITILQSSDQILPTHSHGVQERARDCLAKQGIRLLTNQILSGVEGQWAVTQSGQRLQFDEMLVTTGARAADWLKSSDLPVDANGFVRIDPYLKVTGCEGLFAVGDCAHFEDRPLPKSGVYAVRQGPYLIHNIMSVLSGRALKRYRPQRRTLALFTSGFKRALLSYGPLSLEAAWIWHWKDRIDRRFMKAFGPE